MSTKQIQQTERVELLFILKNRFEQHMNRHNTLSWLPIEAKLENQDNKLWTLLQMEKTGGEPDVVDYNEDKNEYLFIDCAKESPMGRRSLCYDRAALESRKTHKPKNNAVDVAEEMGISILTEKQYYQYHPLLKFDTKTSSWVLTPEDNRKLGGAIFCDFRFDRIFTYHNGAESYYAARGFRGGIWV